MPKIRQFRRNIDAMTEAELAAYKGEPRDCRGPCKRTLTVGHFEITTERGKKVVRTQCRECMASYYTSPELKERRKRRYRIWLIKAAHLARMAKG